MNFFEAQAKARRSTTLLVLLFLLGVLGTMALTYLLLIVVWTQFDGGDALAVDAVMAHNDMQSMFVSGGIVLAIVFIGSVYKMSQLSSGGRVVAEALGGRLIPRGSSDAAERRLLNVVDEMALASGIPAPPVFVLEDASINAFAAGLTYDDAVIGVTRGTLNALTREELQGVIAHEFSHIFNGDMRLNSRITGILHGILLIGLIGRQILRMLDSGSRHRHRSSNKKGDAVGAAVMIGIGFTVIGFVGTIFGEMIKATISRQREYLADASAVQYTRYPAGIANALKKIGSAGSEIGSGEAAAYSHFYFADGVKSFWDHLFSTHPQLEARIRRIEPRWDGQYLPLPKKGGEDIIPTEKEERKKKAVFTAATTAAVLDAVERTGSVDEVSVAKARDLLDALPKPLAAMAEHPLSAQAVVLSLLCDHDDTVRAVQFEALEADAPVLLKQVKLAYSYRGDLGEGARLPLLQLCIAPLKAMSASQYGRFRTGVTAFVEADRKLSLFEWALEHLLLRPLDIQFGLKKPPVERHSHIGAVRGELETFLSVLARTQYTDAASARNAFGETIRRSGATALRYEEGAEGDFGAFGRAFGALEEAKAGVRKKVLDMTVDLLGHDGQISASDLELLHAVAAALRLPMPPVGRE